MAITKLLNIKESPGMPSQHLYNAIHYILDEAKTEDGRWIGGNAGIETPEVYENFLDTKRCWNKLDGRQGYHFVISFSPGEVDESKCYEVMEEFCKEYLGDHYDYVFAVHNDKDHIHAHVVFNSVSRIDGYKYHYANGDWERYIQPITDKICREHGLAPLKYEEERIGVSYAAWAAEKGENINWGHIIRADVDLAIERADSMEEFTMVMNRLGYQLRFGHSKKRDENYITFSFEREDGKVYRRRSYNLAPGYSVEEVARKIQAKKLYPSENLEETVDTLYHKVLSEALSNRAANSLKQSAVYKSTKTYKRLYQAVTYYKLPNPYAVPSYQVRKDMIRLDRLIEECSYLQSQKLRTVDAIDKRSIDLSESLKQNYIKRKSLKDLQQIYVDSVEPENVQRFRKLVQQLQRSKEIDVAYEEAEDELNELKKSIPYDFQENEKKILECEKEIQKLKKEKRIVDRISKTERGKEQIIQQEYRFGIRK